MNKLFFSAVILMFQSLGSSYGQSIQNNYIDTSIISILPYKETDYPFFKNCNQVDLTNEDFITIDSLLADFIVKYNKEQTRQFNFFNAEQKSRHVLLLLDLKLFKRQYVAVIKNSGKKEVWINCFCNSLNMDWKKEIIKPSGERMCNFELKINLKTNKYFDFRLSPFKNSV